MDRKKVNIFLIISIVLLILVAIKFNYFGKIFEYKNIWINRNDSVDKTENDYPEFIYESFVDKDGNEVVIEMEKKTGTINGEDIIFYEDTNESQVIYCHYYQGILKEVNDVKIVFLVDKECKNADLDETFNNYKDVENYEIKFYLSDYNTKHNEEFGIRDMITINTIEIKDITYLQKFVGKNLKIIDIKFKDNVTKILVKELDFFIK